MTTVIPINDDLEDQADNGTGQDLSAVTAVPEQIRVAIEVGRHLVEQSLTAHAPLSQVMEKLPQCLKETLDAEGISVTFPDDAVYSLGLEGQTSPFPRRQSLSELGVLDGSILVLRQIFSEEVFSAPIESVEDALGIFNAAKFPEWTSATARALTLAVAVGFSALTSLALIRSWWSTPSPLWWAGPALTLVLLAVAGAAVARHRRNAPQISYVLGIGAVLLAFALGWVAVPAVDGVPGQWTAANLLAASIAAAAISILVLWFTGVGLTVHTAVTTAALVGATASGVMAFTGIDGRQVGSVAVWLSMCLVVAAPKLALALARVPQPNLPAPGEEIDRGELEEAGMQVEVFADGTNNDDDAEAASESGRSSVQLSESDDPQLEHRSTVANKYLTGLWVSASMVMIVGALAALRPRTHYFYGELAVALLAVLVMTLRARTLPDRVQAITFYSAAFLLTSGTVIVVINGFPYPVVQLSILAAVAALGTLTAVAGINLPNKKLPDTIRHRIQTIEFAVIAVIPPILGWVTGLYFWARTLLQPLG